MKYLTTILALTVVVLAVMLWQGCQEQKATREKALQLKARGDSADRRTDSIIKKAKADSAFFAHRDDSLTKRFAKADTSVNHVKATIGALVAIGDAAAARKDTAGQLSSCKDLRDSLKIAKGAVTDLQTSAETLNSAYANEIQQRDSTINILAGAVLQTRAEKDSAISLLLRQTKPSPSRKWHLVIGGGGVAGPNGVGPGVFAGVAYTIF